MNTALTWAVYELMPIVLVAAFVAVVLLGVWGFMTDASPVEWLWMWP